MRLRAVAALVVLVLFPFVVLTLVAGILAGAVYLGSVVAVLGIKVALVAVPVLWALVTAVRDVLRSRPGPMAGIELDRARHPALWAAVDRLADAMGTSRVGRIVVNPTVNAAVTQVSGQREMVIGWPLLAGMQRDELVSVLAHELGHFAAGHTRLTALTYRATATLDTTIARTDNGLARWVLVGYGRLYYLLASSVTRRQELQADDWSARLAGPRVAAAAMRRVVQLDAAWERLVGSYLPLSGPARRRPPLAEGLRSLLEVAPAAQLPPEAARTGRFDSHPAPAVRIARFEAMADAGPPAGAADPAPAWQLLAGGEQDLLALEQELLADDDPPADWQQIVDLAATAESEQLARLVARAVVDLQLVPAGAPVTTGLVLDLFEQGRGSALLHRMVRADLPPDRRAAALDRATRQVLTSVAYLALAVPGRARAVLSWTGPWTREVQDPQTGAWAPLELAELVGPAVEGPSGVAGLRDRLLRFGADLTVPVEPAVEVAREAVAGWGHVFLQTPLEPGGRRRRGRGSVVDVVVYDDGVLVARPDKVPMRGSSGGYQRAGVRRVQELAALPEPPATEPGRRRWIPAGDILEAKAGRRWNAGHVVRLRLSGGETITFGHNASSVAMDSPMERLVAVVAARGARG